MPLHASILRYLDSVARYGTIREAARKLNVSSSSINRQILALEAEFGIRLFERINNGVRLTAAGKLLIEHVRHTARDFEATFARIVSLKGLQSGRVTIATVPSLATTVLATLLTDFKLKFPGITFDIRTANSITVVELVANGDFDVGFSFNPPPHFDVRECHAIDVEVGCVCSADHPLAGRDPLRLAECLEFDLILPSSKLSTREIIDAVFHRRGIRPKIYAESDSLAFIKALVARGAGIAFQPNMALQPELDQKRILFKSVQDAGFETDRLVLVTSSRELSLATEVFVDHACQMLRTHLGGVGSDPVGETDCLSLSGTRVRQG